MNSRDVRVAWIDRVVLVVLAILILVTRLHTYREPVDWDVATYAVIGHEISHGKLLYADAWDIKPPAIFVSYALAEKIAGYGFPQIFLLEIITTWVTLFGVYRAGGLFAAAAFAIISGDMLLEANRPNTEAFINMCMAWAVAMFVRWDQKHALRGAIIAGAWLGLASLYKQVAVAPAVLIAIAHVLAPPPDVSRRSAASNAFVMLGMIALMWGMTFAYFAMTDRGWLFWMTIVESPSAYSISLIGNLIGSLAPNRFHQEYLLVLIPPGLLTLAALAGRKYLAQHCWMILIALIIGTHLSIAITGQFYRHYYQLWFIPLCIGAGWGEFVLAYNARSRTRKLAAVAAALVIVGMVWMQAPSYRLTPEQWALKSYEINFTFAQPAGDELKRLLGPDDTFYEWTDSAWLYFVTNRFPPATGVWRSHTLEGPLAKWLTDQTLDDLSRQPPRFAIVWANDLKLSHPIGQWILANYRPVDDSVKQFPFAFYQRRSDP